MSTPATVPVGKTVSFTRPTSSVAASHNLPTTSTVDMNLTSLHSSPIVSLPTLCPSSPLYAGPLNRHTDRNGFLLGEHILSYIPLGYLLLNPEVVDAFVRDYKSTSVPSFTSVSSHVCYPVVIILTTFRLLITVNHIILPTYTSPFAVRSCVENHAKFMQVAATANQNDQSSQDQSIHDIAGLPCQDSSPQDPENTTAAIESAATIADSPQLCLGSPTAPSHCGCLSILAQFPLQSLGGIAVSVPSRSATHPLCLLELQFKLLFPILLHTNHIVLALPLKTKQFAAFLLDLTEHTFIDHPALQIHTEALELLEKHQLVLEQHRLARQYQLADESGQSSGVVRDTDGILHLEIEVEPPTGQSTQSTTPQPSSQDEMREETGLSAQQLEQPTTNQLSTDQEPVAPTTPPSQPLISTNTDIIPPTSPISCVNLFDDKPSSKYLQSASAIDLSDEEVIDQLDTTFSTYKSVHTAPQLATSSPEAISAAIRAFDEDLQNDELRLDDTAAPPSDVVTTTTTAKAAATTTTALTASKSHHNHHQHHHEKQQPRKQQERGVSSSDTSNEKNRDSSSRPGSSNSVIATTTKTTTTNNSNHPTAIVSLFHHREGQPSVLSTLPEHTLPPSLDAPSPSSSSSSSPLPDSTAQPTTTDKATFGSTPLTVCSLLHYEPTALALQVCCLFYDWNRTNIAQLFPPASNQDYQICDSYPSALPLPAAASVSLLYQVAKYRSKQRVPFVSFMFNKSVLIRCSQPCAGAWGSRNVDDEALVIQLKQVTQRYWKNVSRGLTPNEPITSPFPTGERVLISSCQRNCPECQLNLHKPTIIEQLQQNNRQYNNKQLVASNTSSTVTPASQVVSDPLTNSMPSSTQQSPAPSTQPSSEVAPAEDIFMHDPLRSLATKQKDEQAAAAAAAAAAAPPIPDPLNPGASPRPKRIGSTPGPAPPSSNSRQTTTAAAAAAAAAKTDLVVFDCRPYAAAMGNALFNGKGFESGRSYGARVEFLNIPNIHEMRSSYNTFLKLVCTWRVAYFDYQQTQLRQHLHAVQSLKKAGTTASSDCYNRHQISPFEALTGPYAYHQNISNDDTYAAVVAGTNSYNPLLGDLSGISSVSPPRGMKPATLTTSPDVAALATTSPDSNINALTSSSPTPAPAPSTSASLLPPPPPPVPTHAAQRTSLLNSSIHMYHPLHFSRHPAAHSPTLPLITTPRQNINMSSSRFASTRLNTNDVFLARATSSKTSSSFDTAADPEAVSALPALQEPSFSSTALIESDPATIQKTDQSVWTKHRLEPAFSCHPHALTYLTHFSYDPRPFAYPRAVSDKLFTPSKFGKSTIDASKAKLVCELFLQSPWVAYQNMLLIAANNVVATIVAGYSSVIHCSDNFDRTSQLCILVQILLDPFYRTLPGICTLLERELFKIGHRIKDRSMLGTHWNVTGWDVVSSFGSSHKREVKLRPDHPSTRQQRDVKNGLKSPPPCRVVPGGDSSTSLSQTPSTHVSRRPASSTPSVVPIGNSSVQSQSTQPSTSSSSLSPGQTISTSTSPLQQQPQLTPQVQESISPSNIPSSAAAADAQPTIAPQSQPPHAQYLVQQTQIPQVNPHQQRINTLASSLMTLNTTLAQPACLPRASQSACNEYSPIFQQLLEVIYQLLHQFPTEFEYNSTFLYDLYLSAFSGRFAIFEFNTDKERTNGYHTLYSHPHHPDAGANALDAMYWSFFLRPENISRYQNPQYKPSPPGGTDAPSVTAGAQTTPTPSLLSTNSTLLHSTASAKPLTPHTGVQHMVIWKELYLLTAQTAVHHPVTRPLTPPNLTNELIDGQERDVAAISPSPASTPHGKKQQSMEVATFLKNNPELDLIYAQSVPQSSGGSWFKSLFG